MTQETDTTTSPSEGTDTTVMDGGDPAAAPAAGEAAPAAPQEGEKADSGTEGTVMGGEQQEGTEAAPEGAPDKYEFSLNDEDGNPVSLDQEMLDAAEPVLRELNLTNDQANQLLPLVPQIIERAGQQFAADTADQFNAVKAEWASQYEADPEIGGANKKQTEESVAKAMVALGYNQGHPFREALNATGFGNHPDLIRAFNVLGQMVSEEGHFARGGEGTTGQPAGWESRYKKQES